MNDLDFVPRSVPEAREALAAMERDVDAAKTYAEIRKLERRAEALKALFREYEAVKQDAERVILLARHRIGVELKAAPVAKGAREPGTNRGTTQSATGTASPTIAEQIGSKQRGWRLKQLAEVGREQLLNAASTLWEKGKDVTQTAVLKLIASDETKARREASRATEPLPDGMELRIGDCRRALADVTDNSIPLILTDPPYGDGAEALYRWLAGFAKRTLIPGGSLICYTGQSRLDRDMAILSSELRYWWLLAMMHDQSQRLPGKFVIANFKPVLWYVKHHRRGRTLMPDVLKPPKREKDDHPWGQGEGGVGQIIEHLTEPGELIIDPFAGTGKWGAVAADMGRRWIGVDVVSGGSTETVAAEKEEEEQCADEPFVWTATKS